MTATESMEMHRQHGGTDQTWSGCYSCMIARRAAKPAPKAWTTADYRAARIITRRFPADGYSAPGVCRRCGTYCDGDCSSR